MWNISAHIDSHAQAIINNLNPELTTQIQLGNAKAGKEFAHFTTSFLDIDFYSQGISSKEEISKIMKQLHNDIINTLHIIKKDKNGYRTLADGTKKRKYAIRTLDLSQTHSAIHLQDPNGLMTMPHIHILHDTTLRTGKNYSHLKKHITNIAKKYNLSPHFDENTLYDKKEIRPLMKKVSRFAWALEQGKIYLNSNKSIPLEKYLKQNHQATLDNLELLKEYAIKTNTLEFYTKTLTKFNEIIKKHNIPYPEFNDDLISILNDNELENLAYIQSHKIEELDLNSKIARDYIRYSLNKRSPIIDFIKTNHPQQGAFIYKDDNILKNLKNKQREKPTYQTKSIPTQQSIYTIFQKDFKKALKNAINEKTLKQNLSDLGYQNVKFRVKKRKKVGIKFNHPSKEKPITIEFKKIGYSWSKITIQLMKNQSNNITPVKLEQNKELQNLDLPPFIPNQIVQNSKKPTTPIDDIQTNIDKPTKEKLLKYVKEDITTTLSSSISKKQLLYKLSAKGYSNPSIKNNTFTFSHPTSKEELSINLEDIQINETNIETKLTVNNFSKISTDTSVTKNQELLILDFKTKTPKIYIKDLGNTIVLKSPLRDDKSDIEKIVSKALAKGYDPDIMLIRGNDEFQRRIREELKRRRNQVYNPTKTRVNLPNQNSIQKDKTDARRTIEFKKRDNTLKERYRKLYKSVNIGITREEQTTQTNNMRTLSQKPLVHNTRGLEMLLPTNAINKLGDSSMQQPNYKMRRSDPSNSRTLSEYARGINQSHSITEKEKDQTQPLANQAEQSEFTYSKQHLKQDKFSPTRKLE